ncbi:MAG: TerB N-terminal domain-containing protein [Firmicutes bacterium]|nr:TerB N-terminal domain-containing protein [Bacillota bacterium]
MSAIKQYFAESIPLQKNRAGEYAAALDVLSGNNAGGFSDPSFGAIEYATVAFNATDEAPTWQQPALLPRPLPQRPADPLRQRFLKMRQLAEKDIYNRNTAKLFYQQAKFMEDFTDNFEGKESFTMYLPQYQLMGYRQLRQYFTWRTKVRNGDISPIDHSYVFLYINELLLNIGVSSPSDGLNKLMILWKTLKDTELAPDLNKYLPLWLKDYHVYYELPNSFSSFVNENDLVFYYPLMFLLESTAEKSLELWSKISKYNISKSKFYISGNEKLMQDCFFAVLGNVRELLAVKCISLKYLLFYCNGNGNRWLPFHNSLFFNWLKQPNHQVQMPGGDKYICKNNYWTCFTGIPVSGGLSFAGYLIKKTEACLRQAIKYRYKLSVARDSLLIFEPTLNEVGLSIDALDKSIEKAVADFYAISTRKVVEVNHNDLARIRKEAFATQEKLSIDENLLKEVNINSVKLPPSPEQKTELPTVHVCNPWDNFKHALNEVETQALTIALTGQRDLKQFADKNGIMLEVLVEGINEKAIDHIGDSVIDIAERLRVYEEYTENIKYMVGV